MWAKNDVCVNDDQFHREIVPSGTIITSVNVSWKTIHSKNGSMGIVPLEKYSTKELFHFKNRYSVALTALVKPLNIVKEEVHNLGE